MRSEFYANLAVFLVDTGARPGEGTGLQWNDIEAGRVTFWLTKSGKSRTVPLTRRACEAVSARAGHIGGPFGSAKQYRFRRAWHEARDEIGLGRDADVVPHVLRHTCASQLVRGGIDLGRVQMWLGHRTLQMTMRHAHLATDDLDACLPAPERREKPQGRPVHARRWVHAAPPPRCASRPDAHAGPCQGMSRFM